MQKTTTKNKKPINDVNTNEMFTVLAIKSNKRVRIAFPIKYLHVRCASDWQEPFDQSDGEFHYISEPCCVKSEATIEGNVGVDN